MSTVSSRWVSGAIAVLIASATLLLLPSQATAEPKLAEAECLNTQEQKFLELINNYRSERDLPELKVSAALNRSAYNHSRDMGEKGYFSHRSQDGRSPWDRMAAQGYDYRTAKAENIAAGRATAREVFESWRSSPGHNQHMLNPDLRVIGIGLAEVPDSRYTYYWTTDFGGKVDEAPTCDSQQSPETPETPSPEAPENPGDTGSGDWLEWLDGILWLKQQ